MGSWVPDDPSAAAPSAAAPTGKWVPTAQAPSTGQQLKDVARNTAKGAAGAAGFTAGTYMGGAIGEAVFPAGGGFIGAPIGAAIGGYAAPEISHLTGKLLGESEPPPTSAEAMHSAKVGGLMEMGGPIAGKVLGGAASKLGEVLGGKKDIADTAIKAAQGVGTETPAEMEARAAKAQQDMAAEHAAARQEADQHVAAQREKLLESHTKDAKEETIKGAIGPPPQTPNAVEQVQTPQGPAGVPGQGLVERQQRFRDTIYGIKDRAQQELSGRFDKVLHNHGGDAANTSPMTAAASDSRAHLQQFNLRISPKVEQLVAEAEAMEGTGVPGKPKFIQKGNRVVMVGGGGGATTTVDQLLGYRSRVQQAMEAASGLTRGADRKVLSFLEEGAEGALPEVPGLDKVRATWREFRHGLGDWDFLGKAGDAANPNEVAPEIFNHPERGLQMATGASPEEKQVLRDTLAGWVDKKGAGVITKDHAPILEALGYKGPLTNPKGWMFENQAVKRVGEIFDTAPQAKQKYFDALKEVRDHEEGEVANRVVALATKQAKSLGPAGQNIMRTIDAAKTPVAKAQAALKAFASMRPEGVSSQFEAAQREAGEGAIRGYEPGSAKGFVGMMQRYGTRMAAIGALAAPFSSFGGSLAARGGIALGVAGAAGMLSKAYQASLRYPAAASEFYDAIMNPGTRAGMTKLARATLNGLISEKVGEATAPAKEPTPSSTPGPMSKDIERKQAIAISSKEKQSDEGHVDHIQGLNKDIASGKDPDIQHDLSSGRISNAEVLKMVKNEPAGLDSMFKGMSLPDALDAFKKGTSDEKALALGALSQKINDEGRNLQPQQRKALLAQLRAALAEQGETV